LGLELLVLLHRNPPLFSCVVKTSSNKNYGKSLAVPLKKEERNPFHRLKVLDTVASFYNLVEIKGQFACPVVLGES
jgi:hypothetical protein